MQPNDQQPLPDGANSAPEEPVRAETDNLPVINFGVTNGQESQEVPTAQPAPAVPTAPTVNPPENTPTQPFGVTGTAPTAPVPTYENTPTQPFVMASGPSPAPVAAPVVGSAPKQRFAKFSSLTKKSKIIVLAVAVFVVLLGSSAGAYYGIIVPNRPENIWKSAMTNSGKAYDALSSYATKPRDAKGSVVDGSYSVKGALVSDGKFTSKSLGADSQSTGSISAAGLQIGFDVRTLKSTGETPDMYFKLTGLQGLGSLIGGESEIGTTINGVNDQWFVVDHTLFEQLGTSANTQYTREDAANLLKSVGGPTKEYLFSADNQKAVFEVKQMVGPEDKDGRKTYHYKVAYDSTNLGKYVTSLCDTLKKDKIGKELFARETVDCAHIAKETANNKSNGTADVWVDKRTKLPHVVRINDSDNYIEIGQDYQGGSSYPFSINLHSKENNQSVDASIKGSLDTKKDTVKIDGSFTAKGMSGEKDTTGKLSLTISPSNDTSLKVEKPQNAKSLIEFINGLGLGDIVGGGQVQARDQQRVTDINNIHAKLEEYSNNNNGSYPSTFTAATLDGIDEGSLRDPVGNDLIRFVSPVANVDAATAYPAPTSDTAGTAAYLYIPYPTGCTDNCSGYILKSFIEKPSASITNPYVKKSLSF